MKIVTLPLVSLIASLSLTAPAMAQHFDGPSAGVQVGWVQNDLRTPDSALGTVTVDASQDSPVVGGYIGYDKEFGKFVLGAEGGLSVGTDDRVTFGSGIGSVSIDPKRSFDLTARGGYLVTPQTLLYARGGYANDRVRATLGSPSGPIAETENRDGWLVGGGVERVILPQLSARLEYRYADLSEGEGQYDRHQVLTGVTFRF